MRCRMAAMGVPAAAYAPRVLADIPAADIARMYQSGLQRASGRGRAGAAAAGGVVGAAGADLGPAVCSGGGWGLAAGPVERRSGRRPAAQPAGTALVLFRRLVLFIVVVRVVVCIEVGGEVQVGVAAPVPVRAVRAGVIAGHAVGVCFGSGFGGRRGEAVPGAALVDPVHQDHRPDLPGCRAGLRCGAAPPPRRSTPSPPLPRRGMRQPADDVPRHVDEDGGAVGGRE